MPQFKTDQRVRIPVNNQHAPSQKYGQTGTITDDFAGITMRSVNEQGLGDLVERQYNIRFDGADRDEICWESWLEATG